MRATPDKRDIYFRAAKEEGYLARSAYKLMQLDEEFDLFNDQVSKCVDLCAAPGSWSQVAVQKLREREKSKIVAIDLQPMKPLAGVHILRGDITKQSTVDRVIHAMGDVLADLVICDGAPDVTGMSDMDMYIQADLISAAVTIMMKILRREGTFVAKVFCKGSIPLLQCQMEVLFEDVCFHKPPASRPSSMESFLVCEGYLGSPDDPAFPLFLERGSLKGFNGEQTTATESRMSPILIY
ncbi:hypothetical protein SmJEL517_g00696 [Synchytrium microbalum]|uniref:Ribosomal RNA methyltransferase FtsJ domain-containing protein n=1 Tax=Synchytrium microbalum TaxID=1806994 RepID=A0A507CE49_9FUNG|nr:uncharacterized protein SmJEL517_g00696 [Synchytrium microbalum]TPX37628.1 hypothetical protein SmJEL517_g00696 [Synchytrium microbalum]